MALLYCAGGHIHHETKRQMNAMPNWDYEYIVEGTTSLNQPLDAVYFGPFKIAFRACFRRKVAKWKHSQPRNGRNQYTLGIREYRRFIVDAIDEVQTRLQDDERSGLPSRIRKCFRELGYSTCAAEPNFDDVGDGDFDVDEEELEDDALGDVSICDD